MKLTMRDIARSGHVTRWHSVRTARDQTLAEHSYMVAMISREIAKQVYGKKLTCDDMLLLLEYSLTHDSAEILVSDIGTPMKRKIEEVCAKHGMDSPIDMIEAEIVPDVFEMKDKMKDTALPYIAKISDILDALIFIKDEGVGKLAVTVEKKLERMLDSKLYKAQQDFPELNWQAVREIYAEMVDGKDNQIEFELS